MVFNGLLKYKKKSLYLAQAKRKDSLDKQTYDYSDNLINQAVSGQITRNATLRDFLSLVNDYLINIRDSINTLYNYKNFTVNKHKGHLNE